MPTLPTDVRLAYEQKTTIGALYYKYKRCGGKTTAYRRITRHLHRRAKKGWLGAPLGQRRA
jgi:Uri superfamily endonuclease